MTSPDRTTILIVAMGGVIVILAIVLAFVLGRQSAEPDATSAPANNVAVAAPPAKGNLTAPARPADPDDALSRWLAGGWAEESTNCQTDTGDYYDPSGRFGRSGAEGLWRIENGQLVVTITHESVGDPMAQEYIGLPNPETTRSRLTRESQDRMVQVIDGRPVRMMRCPLAHHSFAT
jgi:hypothetical protein